MNDTIEVDRDYLWALEVLAVGRIPRGSDVTRSDFKEARRVVKNSGLTQPRPRYPDGEGPEW